MAETPKHNTAKRDTPRYGKGSGFHGKPGRSGPPVGNSNALRHGLRSGKLSPDCQYIEHQTNRLRRELEDAVVSVRGEVSLTAAGIIQTAVKWQTHSALCLRWLRLEGDKLKPEQKLKFSESAVRASDNRDKAIKNLDLDTPAQAIDLTTYLVASSKEIEDD